MPKKAKPTEPVGPPKGWVVCETFQMSPQVTLSKGDECRVKGEQGKFVFLRHVWNTNTNSEWVDVWGGSAGHSQWRSVRIERLKHIPKKRSRKQKEPRSHK
jgi:hypothetical protein